MDITGQSQGQLVEILIKLAGSLTEEDLMDPATFALASQLVQMLDPKADPLPQELVDQLKNIQNKATRFKMAAQAIGANRPDLMDKLVDSMKAAGLWKAEAHIKKMDWRRRNAQFKHQDRQEEEKELTKAEPPAKPTFNQHIRSVAESYAEPRGIHLQHDIPKVKVNPEFASKVATAYHGLEHSPAHPQTKAAYDALIDETTQQLHHLQRNGYKFTPIKPGQANPYASGSAALAADLRDNKHAHYYPTEQGFGSGDSMHPNHPLLRTVKDLDGNEMPANDAFRIVHDVFGHAKEGTSFGPQGEEAAYRHHYQMFSPLARRALTSETRGQNSWVNFGPHAAHNRANPDRTVFAEQKAGLLPEWAEHHYTDEVKKSVINFQKPKQNDGIFDIDRHLPSSNQSVEAKKDFTVRSHTPSGHPISYDSDVFSEKRAEQTHKDMTAEDHAWASHYHETKSASLGNSDKGRVHRLYGDWHTKKAKEKDPGIHDIRHYGGPNFNLLNAPDIRRKLTKSENLDKGINGDWEKEGYTFRTSRSKKAGHTVKAYKGRTRVGHMAFSEMPDSKDGYHHVYAAHISEEHRGKGLYQEMIRQGVKHAQSLGSKGLKTDGFQRSGDATRAWEKINPEKRETNPSMIGGKRFSFYADERHLNKSENDHYLEHYSSKDTKFDTLDPNFHGTGVSGDERKRLGRPNRTYYYDKGTANEPRVIGPAKFKYVIKAPSKILDLDSKEAKPHLDAAKTSAGIVDHTQLEHNIKNAGYDGYRHSGSALPNVVALFHAQKPTETHDLREVKKSEGSDLNKSDTSEHFAVALHRKFGYPIRAVMNKDKVVGHFYAHDPKTGHALDVSGRKIESEIPKTFKGMGSTDHYHVGTERDLHALMGRKVDEKGVSDALNIINRAPAKYAPSHFKSEESAKAEATVSNKETILKKAQDLIDRLRKSGKDKEADILEESLSKTDDHSYNIYTVPGREGEHHVFADNVNELDEDNHPKNVGYMHIQDNKINHISIHPAHRSHGLPARMYKKAKLLVSSDVKKSELDTLVVYEELIKGKNRREQQAKVFGGWKTSPESPRRAKQMAALEDQGKRRYGLETERAPGKPNASGKIIDKPTFDNPGNKIQHIGNPDSLVHEHAHLEVEKEGSGLKQFQADMDHEWGAQNKKFGYKQQARGKEEYSTTALENPLRRRAGLPAHQKETKEKNPKRDYAADEPGKKITQEIPGGKRLTGTSSNRAPEHNRRMDQVDRGELKFDAEKGWQPGTGVNSKINQRARSIAENPANGGRKDAKTLMRGEDGSKPLSFNDMKKADLAKSWEIKVKGQEGYHPVRDVVDQGSGKQNAYILHDGTKVDHERIEDLRIGGKNAKDTPRNPGPTPLKPKR